MCRYLCLFIIAVFETQQQSREIEIENQKIQGLQMCVVLRGSPSCLYAELCISCAVKSLPEENSGPSGSDTGAEGT